ncbi:MAG: FtsX-like permease family protein [Rhodothermales bacterium]|nr:FtsX-like permease family protein [Rhodothermales bacterium]
MAFLEAFRMAIAALRGHKMRSSLTLAGMVVGVFAIIVSITAVKVIDVYFKDRINFLGAQTFTITRWPSFQFGQLDQSIRNRPRISYDQIERLERTLSLPATVSPIEDFQLSRVKYRDLSTEPNIILLGTDEDFLGNFSWRLEQGRFITAEDVQYARPVAVLGSEIVEEVFPNETALGKTIRFDGHRFEVIGVLESKGNFLGFSLDSRLYTPITRGFTLYGAANRNIASTSVRASNPVLYPAVVEEVTGRFRTIRKVPPGEPNSFEISTNDTMQSVFAAFTGTLTTAGAIIGLIALLAAGIGIMNIMLVSVTERTREIGVRKSVGAKRKDIMRQFLLEAFFLCQVGGVIGIVLGIIVGNGTAIYFEIEAAFPWGWAISAVVMVTIISLVFGGYPAFKAARLDPIESLRYE